MKFSLVHSLVLLLISLSLSACNASREKHRDEAHKIKVATLRSKTVTHTQRYVGQIRSHHRIMVRAPLTGYLGPVPIREGQQVKQDDVLFQVVPLINQAKLDAENAEAMLAQLELNGTKKLHDDKVVPRNEVMRHEAKLAKAQANVQLAAAELNFATIKAPFDGMVDRLSHQEGSLVQKGESLTTLSDNSLMWVYFNVSEGRYLEFMSAHGDQHQDDVKIELLLANGKKFDQPGKFSAVAADFNSETGSIPFRVDFPNPDRLLRHGQTGTVLISRVQNDAIVIPQRATFEVGPQRRVYVIDNDDVAHERPVVVQNELDDEFVIKTGISVGDKIVVDGVALVHDGHKVDY